MNIMQVGGDDQEVQARVSGIGTTAITGYSWSSSDTGVLTVTPAGDGFKASLHAVAAGDATVTMTADPLSATTFTVKVVDADAGRAMVAFSSPTGQTGPNDPNGQQPNPGAT